MGIRNAFGNLRIMNELFTSAEREAQLLGDEEPGPEHLLLAALGLPDGSARRAFAKFGVSPDDVRHAITATHADALRTMGIDTVPPAVPAREPKGAYRSTGSARDAFQRAAALCKLDRPSKLDSAYLVIAVADPDHGTSARVLRQLGIDRAALQDAAREALATR